MNKVIKGLENSPYNIEENTKSQLFEKEITGKNRLEKDCSNLYKKKIWRVADVAIFMNVSKGHIYNLCYKSMIPKYKKGKCLYFIPDEILEWILQGELV